MKLKLITLFLVLLGSLSGCLGSEFDPGTVEIDYVIEGDTGFVIFRDANRPNIEENRLSVIVDGERVGSLDFLSERESINLSSDATTSVRVYDTVEKKTVSSERLRLSELKTEHPRNESRVVGEVEEIDIVNDEVDSVSKWRVSDNIEVVNKSPMSVKVKYNGVSNNSFIEAEIGGNRFEEVKRFVPYVTNISVSKYTEYNSSKGDVSAVEKGEVVGHYDQGVEYVENLSIDLDNYEGTVSIEYVDVRSLKGLDNGGAAEIISSKVDGDELVLEYKVNGDYKLEWMVWHLRS